MNFSFDSIKRVFAKLRTNRSGSSDHGVIHPLREWFGSLFVGLLLVVVGVGWATQVFWRYDEMVKNPSFLETAPDPTYREALVSQALKVLETRQDLYTQIEHRLRGEGQDEAVVTEIDLPAAATTTASTTPVAEEVIEPSVSTTSTTPDTGEVPVEVSN